MNPHDPDHPCPLVANQGSKARKARLIEWALTGQHECGGLTKNHRRCPKAAELARMVQKKGIDINGNIRAHTSVRGYACLDHADWLILFSDEHIVHLKSGEKFLASNYIAVGVRFQIWLAAIKEQEQK